MDSLIQITPLQNLHLNEIKKISLKKFNQFKACNCCEIHKSNKPENLNDIRFLDKLGPIIHKDCDCKCDCRHKMRWLCRIQDGFVPSDVSRFLFELKFPKNVISYDDLEESFSKKCYCSSAEEEEEEA